MDGVPMLTQCPIASFTTFQYKFRASSPGTHLWHAHSNAHMADGIFGALIVRQPDLTDPQKRLYDIDNKDYLMVVSEWNRKSSFSKTSARPSLLINGNGNFNGLIPEFRVKHGLRYRFRVVFASGASSCPVELSVENHPVKVIALDGHPTVPYEATSIVLGRGERLDFVLKANKFSDRYLINVKSKCEDSVNSVAASLVYEDSNEEEQENNEIVDVKEENLRVFQTDGCDTHIGKVCINNAQSLFVMPSSLRHEKVDNKLFLMFDHLIMEKFGKYFTNQQLFNFLQPKLLNGLYILF